MFGVHCLHLGYSIWLHKGYLSTVKLQFVQVMDDEIDINTGNNVKTEQRHFKSTVSPIPNESMVLPGGN